MFLSSDARQIKLARAAGLRRFGNLNSLFESNTIFAELGKIMFDSPDFLDMTAQSGKYAPGETDLRRFIVEGEQGIGCMWRSTGLPGK